jgi:two-component system sensor histidine kinase UhpB
MAAEKEEYSPRLEHILEKLKKSESELEQIFNTAANGMWVVDTEHNVIRINETFWNLNVLTGRSIKNKKCHEVFQSSLCNTERCPLTKIMQGEESVECELEKKRLDGKTATFLVKAVPFRSHDGSLIGIVEDLRDITRLKLAEERTRKLSQKLINAIEDERARISRELHDELGQSLTSIRMDASWLKDHIFKSSVRDRSSLKNVLIGMCDSVDRLIDEVREISFELRPSILDDMGLEAAVLWLVEEFRNRSKIECITLFDLNQKRLTGHIETSLYRIIQESLTNVARHSRASSVIIELIEKDDMLKLQIIDNGVGIDTKKIMDSYSAGIAGMFERAKILGGELEIKGRRRKGTRITVTVPLLDVKDKDEI